MYFNEQSILPLNLIALAVNIADNVINLPSATTKC